MDENEVKIAEVAKPETPVKKKKKGLVIALVAVLVAALAIVVAVFMLRLPNSSLKKAAIGDTVTFGAYEQDNNTKNGKEPIEWIVLDKKGDKLLVISKYALDTMPYNTEQHSLTWENCSLRSWLNGEFFQAAFCVTERVAIAKTTVNVGENPLSSVKPGNNTEDMIFLLSVYEEIIYFKDEASCAATGYAIAQGADISSQNEPTCRWWLRSPGIYDFTAGYVNLDGSCLNYGQVVADDSICVRPAMWIDLAAVKVYMPSN